MGVSLSIACGIDDSATAEGTCDSGRSCQFDGSRDIEIRKPYIIGRRSRKQRSQFHLPGTNASIISSLLIFDKLLLRPTNAARSGK